jgi:uncharacterized protein YndB with AHSA1/START domain
MLKTVLLIVTAAIALLLIYAATRPDTFAVERSTTIAAPADKLFPLINDMRQFNSWNPYARKDPAMKAEYSGAAAGPGAVFDFQGNKDVGKGRISITGADEPSRVTMQLDMWEPFEGHNEVNFTLAPDGPGTRVTWAMQGPSAFVTKLMGVFFNMDQMIGKDFDAGLANLKQLAEKG